MTVEPGEATRLLDRLNQGDREAMARLVTVVYDELRSLADGYLRGERPDHTLQPTALVHEAYLRLVGGTTPQWESRGHFLAVAANSMRQILVNHAKHRGRLKRGGGARRLDLRLDLTAFHTPDLDVLALDEALRKLATINERKVKVVELRYFAGLSAEQAADVLGTSTATVKRDWDFARTWLLRQIGGHARTDG
jgi:RNA polymerase sigma factor (TIGR02999 family)